MPLLCKLKRSDHIKIKQTGCLGFMSPGLADIFKTYETIQVPTELINSMIINILYVSTQVLK